MMKKFQAVPNLQIKNRRIIDKDNTLSLLFYFFFLILLELIIQTLPLVDM